MTGIRKTSSLAFSIYIKDKQETSFGISLTGLNVKYLSILIAGLLSSSEKAVENFCLELVKTRCDFILDDDQLHTLYLLLA